MVVIKKAKHLAREPSESSIQREICDYLTQLGFWVWKNRTEGMRTGGGGRARNPNAGIPDLCAVKNGKTFFIEIKKPSGKVSEVQWRWHEKAADFGLKVTIATCIDDLAEILK